MSNKAKTNYTRLRARLISQGTNLKRFAELRGYPMTTVYGAARGDRAGVEAVRILRELKEVANG